MDKDSLYIAAEDAIYRYLEAYDLLELLSMEDFAELVLDALVEASRKIEAA